MNRLICLCVNALLLAGSAAAQNLTWTLPAPPPEAAQLPEPGAIFFQEGPGTASFHAANGQATFFHYEIAGSQEAVKNAPYTATAVTESTQTLADGNRIVHKSSTFLARDSQGRTR